MKPLLFDGQSWPRVVLLAIAAFITLYAWAGFVADTPNRRVEPTRETLGTLVVPQTVAPAVETTP